MRLLSDAPSSQSVGGRVVSPVAIARGNGFFFGKIAVTSTRIDTERGLKCYVKRRQRGSSLWAEATESVVVAMRNRDAIQRLARIL